MKSSNGKNPIFIFSCVLFAIQVQVYSEKIFDACTEMNLFQGICKTVGNFGLGGEESCQDYVECRNAGDHLEDLFQACNPNEIFGIIEKKCISTDNITECPQKLCSSEDNVEPEEVTKTVTVINTEVNKGNKDTSYNVFPPKAELENKEQTKIEETNSIQIQTNSSNRTPKLNNFVTSFFSIILMYFLIVHV